MSTEEGIPSDWLNFLKIHFGHSDFRPNQLAVIKSILNDRRDSCFFTSSAYGKSLTYQFPPVYTDSIGIVVSPLISLMEDQVREMLKIEVRACFLGSAQKNTNTKDNIIDGQHNLVYVTPEYITSDAGEDLLNKIQDKITLIAIDEAHCISKWGHDFRPPYSKLSQLRLICPGVPILALSATATGRVKEDIINGLALHEPQIINISVDRPNLYFSVKHKTTFNWTARHDFSSGISSNLKLYDTTSDIWNNKVLLDFASEVWKDIGPYIETTCGSIIVYCINKRMTEAVAGAIKRHNHECGVYNSDEPLEERSETQEDFLLGRFRILCATVAYGMGTNKTDVRLVIFYGATSSVERFYQKAGAAGRDGSPANCVVFHHSDDWSLHAFMRVNPNYKISKEEAQHKQKLMELMNGYVSSSECRRHYILSYFEENCNQLQPHPDCCDVCNALF